MRRDDLAEMAYSISSCMPFIKNWIQMTNTACGRGNVSVADGRFGAKFVSEIKLHLKDRRYDSYSPYHSVAWMLLVAFWRTFDE